MPQNQHMQPQHSNIPDEEKQKLLEASQVSLWLDTYDDIFSDFDPRPYSQRALSDDFLHEARKTMKETNHGRVELKLLIPESQRNTSYEHLIKKRLKEYFNMRFAELKENRKKILMQGSFFIAISLVVMFTTTFLLLRYGDINFYIKFFSVIGEPAGWFLFWEGLNLIIFDSKHHLVSLKFNQKMRNSNITFIPY